jgi:hypothetical protein
MHKHNTARNKTTRQVMTNLEMTKLRFLSAIRYDTWSTVWIPDVDLLLAHDRGTPLLGSQAALLIIRCPDWLRWPTIRVPLSADPSLPRLVTVALGLGPTV